MATFYLNEFGLVLFKLQALFMQYGAWQARLVCSFYPALVNQYEQNKYGTLNSYRALSTKDYL